MGLRYVFTGSMQGYRNVMNVAASCVVRLTRHPLSQMRFLGQSFVRRSPWLSDSGNPYLFGGYTPRGPDKLYQDIGM